MQWSTYGLSWAHKYHCELKQHLWRGPGRGWTRPMRMGRSGSSSQHLKISRHHQMKICRHQQTEDMPSPPEWYIYIKMSTNVKPLTAPLPAVEDKRHQHCPYWATGTEPLRCKASQFFLCQPHPYWKKLYQLCLVFSPLCPGYCLPNTYPLKRMSLQSFLGFACVL